VRRPLTFKEERTFAHTRPCFWPLKAPLYSAAFLTANPASKLHAEQLNCVEIIARIRLDGLDDARWWSLAPPLRAGLVRDGSPRRNRAYREKRRRHPLCVTRFMKGHRPSRWPTEFISPPADENFPTLLIIGADRRAYPEATKYNDWKNKRQKADKGGLTNGEEPEVPDHEDRSADGRRPAAKGRQAGP
jgi:hypothetical protein